MSHYVHTLGQVYKEVVGLSLLSEPRWALSYISSRRARAAGRPNSDVRQEIVNHTLSNSIQIGDSNDSNIARKIITQDIMGNGFFLCAARFSARPLARKDKFGAASESLAQKKLLGQLQKMCICSVKDELKFNLPSLKSL